MEKVIVIGTNHAGTHAVSTLIENYSEDVTVTTYDRNNNISFLGCGMALWIGNVIKDDKGLFYATPEGLKQAGAQVFMEHELIDVDYNKKEVTLKDLNTDKIFTDNYDKLILAVGSWPILPKLPGHDLENIVYAKIHQNAINVIEKLKNPEIKKIAVVGAGYIGVELAEAFRQNGREVYLINDSDVLNRYYDPEFQTVMNKNLSENGVHCQTGELVTEFKGKDNKVCKVITTKAEYEVDMVLMAIGFCPNTEIVKDPNLEMLANGAILTDDYCETTIPGVYAIGDCATVRNNATHKQQNIALASNAVRTGIVAAHNAAGTKIPMQGVQGSNAIHIFGLTLASTGLTEVVAKEQGFKVGTTTVEDNLRPEFMPTNAKVTLKIVWDQESRRILGAQLMSQEDITLALHMFSLAIQEQYSIDKLALLDLFFLPHFNQPHNFITKAGLQALGK